MENLRKLIKTFWYNDGKIKIRKRDEIGVSE